MALREAGRTLLARLRWELREETMPSRDRPTIARTFTYLFGLGATLVLLSLAFTSVEHWEPILGVVVAAYATTVLLLTLYDRTPGWFLAALPFFGTLLITVIIAFAGAEVVTVYATLYFWAVLSASSFYGVRLTVLNLAWVGLCYAAVLGLEGGVHDAGLRWLMVMATLSVLALIISALRDRTERLVESLRRRSLKQQKVAELGRRALEGASIAELSTGAAEAVAAGLGVRYAAVFELLPNGDELLLKGEHGSRPERFSDPVVSSHDPLIAQALAAAEPVITPDHVAVSVLAAGGPLGVLAAYSDEPRRFDEVEVAFLQAAAHVLGEATERQRVAVEREHRALHDHLTGRPNRSLFTDRLSEALIRAGQEDSIIAVFFLDIDDFKLVNDGFGHGAGDELLRAFGPRLRDGLVMTDTVARFGGDEFAVLCEDVDGEAHATAIAERLRAALGEPFEIGGAPYRVSASIGVALSAGDVGSEDLIAHADAAMYRAKERTRGGYEFFDAALRDRVRKRLAFESELRAAPAEGQLHLVVQPIVSLPSGSPVGSEALLRWTHPDLGPVSPGEFIPVAEETGAILPIGDWVIREAFELAARWRSDPYHRRFLPLHVNISARQLAQPDLPGQITREVERTGARLRDICFEITEHALLSEAADTVATLETLQNLGFPIVLDDFGTGYSSLSHLKRFPIDTVKIDRLFVSNLTTERKDEAIVNAVIGMADAFALDVVAEGIETPEQAARLARLGCRFGQGFLFARPTRVEDLADLQPISITPEADSRVVPLRQPSLIPTALRASALDE